jgi:glycosyltransferase involved in cell wall biosynthesis
VLVVEQGDPSASAVCASIGLDATVVSDSGVGASRARNIGSRRASGGVVLFTDDDCEVPVDWIPNHVAALQEPGVIASFGPVVGIRYVEDSDPTAMPARHRRGSVPWIIGHASNMAVRRSAFDAVGGFDERIGPGIRGAVAGEDADLIARLLRTGSVLTSGTGQPVRHIAWRSSNERRNNVIAYEHGAGVWIGKALREEPRAAMSFFRARVKLQKDTVEYAKNLDDASIPRAAFSRAFARGILAGIRMRPWRTRHSDSQ